MTEINTRHSGKCFKINFSESTELFKRTPNNVEPKLYKNDNWIEIQDGHHHSKKYNMGPYCKKYLNTIVII
jgi:hypothetical protein